MAHLQLDAARIASARASARQIAQQVWQEMQPHTTTTVERASLRLMGVDGVDDNQVPLPNRVVEHLQTQGLLPLGAAVVVAAAMAEQGWTAQQVAQAVAAGRLTLGAPRNLAAAQRSAREQARLACDHIQRQRDTRAAKIAAVGEARAPWL